jgi:predicted RNA binding protein YcfA (HicA-like mRNA interferase family)
MSTKEKLLAKIRNNPAGISFKELGSALSQCGWMLDHQTGSHMIWRSPIGFRLPLQKRSDGKAKGYQVKQFIEQYTREAGHEKK